MFHEEKWVSSLSRSKCLMGLFFLAMAQVAKFQSKGHVPYS